MIHVTQRSSIVNSVISKYKKKFVWIIFTIISVVTIPPPAGMLNTQLDASGAIAISWAALKNLQIGKDVLIQTGPLGYLSTNAYAVISLWFQSMLYFLITHFFFVFSIALLVTRFSLTWKDYLLVFFVVLSLGVLTDHITYIDDEIEISAAIIFYLIISHKIENKYEKPLLIFVSVLLAVHTLIKVDMIIMSLFIIITYSLISVYRRESKNVIAVWLPYVFSIPILWILSGQQLSNLPSYFTSGVYFSSGYSYALAIDGPRYQIYEGLAGLGFVIILFLYSLTKKIRSLTTFMLLSSILLFESFKHGFVRQDTHVVFFFWTFGIFFISSYIIYRYSTGFSINNREKTLVTLLIILASILCVVNIDILVPDIMQNIPSVILSWQTIIPLAVDKTYQTQIIENFKNVSRGYFNLDNETVQYIGNKTMDILPWDIALPWGYDFNWSPLPTWQSFLVYSPQIDEVNAQHFLNKKNAPKTILYAYESIDNRYPIFDEPLTFESILNNYQYAHTSEGFVLLSHNSKDRWETEENLGTMEDELGKPIKIPKYTSGYEFANIDLKFSTYGKFMNTVYKPANAYMRFKFSNSTYSGEFRLIPMISNDGVFVSQYISGTDDLASVFAGNITNDINEITIYADDPAQYVNKIQVKFVGMPASISSRNITTSIMPNWNSLKLVQGGMYSIDWIGNRLYKYEQGNSIVNDDKKGLQFIDMYGWAVDNISKDGNVKTFVVFQNGTNEITVPTQKVIRSDLVKVFGINSYLYGGWKTTINSHDFNGGCYLLSLRVLRSDNQTYFEIGKTEKPICFN